MLLRSGKLWFHTRLCSSSSQWLWCLTFTLRTQLFESQIALIQDEILIWVSYSSVQNHFLGQFSLFFIELQIITLLAK